MAEAMAVLSGVVISVMLLMNGKLTAAYGNYPATVFIHVSGLAAVCIVLLVMRQSMRGTLREPKHLYLGGAIGVFTVLCTNLAYMKLGVSLTLVLSLLGQIAASLVVDGLGILGAVKTSFNKKKLIGVALAVAGAALMLLS